MHQRNFTDADGTLFCFDKEKPEKGVFRKSPLKLFVARHLYSQVDPSGKRDATLEIRLGQFEGQIRPVLDRFIHAARHETYRAVTKAEIDLWLDYFYLQGKRTPDAMKDNLRNFDPNAHLDQVLAKARLLFPSRYAEIDEIDQPAERERLIKNATVNAVGRGSRTVSGILKWRGIAIAHVNVPGRSLVLGSHPVVRMQSSDIRDLNTEMWLPIAPDVAVGLGHGNGKILALEINDTTAIRRMNVAIAGQSRLIAGQSQELIRSLARHFGINA
jgi:hypothetical protein